ncbi:helix-turn-helix domain-containing protein [Bifidobacterium callitrichidarum]|uniref:HTH cro/C1-type domain-containing protein n=1 Tax=Bifidobacterium callitrichidarum TaxID=2052941 RepID=A0A2U2N996_9BIFI|nr:helix-turn-helix domain-containing protein [Bifidobacterium callitrichidarum]PWG65657.1 hypothetical protein DF196_06915 [Bifidobacterium callitrichidarum]
MQRPDQSAQIVSDIRNIQRFVTSTDPEIRPDASFARLQRLQLRDIVAALTFAELNDREYRTLLDFAMTTLTAQETKRLINRTGSEFMFLRNRCGVAQQWAADSLGVSLSTVRRWEDPDQPYAPSHEAWKWLDGLDEYVERTAYRAVVKPGEWHDVCELVKQLGDLTENGSGAPAPPSMIDGLDATLTVRFFSSQKAYLDMVNRFYPKSGEPEGGVEALEAGCAFTVFPDAGYFGVQNAITQRAVGLIRDAGRAHGWPARLITLRVIR